MGDAMGNGECRPGCLASWPAGPNEFYHTPSPHIPHIVPMRGLGWGWGMGMGDVGWGAGMGMGMGMGFGGFGGWRMWDGDGYQAFVDTAPSDC